MPPYRFGNLVFDSDLRLPGVDEAPGSRPRARLRLVRPVPKASEPAWEHHWCQADGRVSLSLAREGSAGYRLGFPGLAEFSISADGQEISCRPRNDVPAEAIGRLMAHQVLPRVLSLGKDPVLHAGAVWTPQGVCVFLGESGSGKSTLCANFARQGFPLLGDDCILLRRGSGGNFVVHPGNRGLSLLPDSLGHFRGAGAAPEAAGAVGPKRRINPRRTGVPMAAGPAPLGRLFLLERQEGPSSAQELRVTPLSQREALMALIRNSFQLEVLSRERAGHVLQCLGDVAERASILRLEIPRDFSRLPAARAAVLAALPATGGRSSWDG